MGLNMFYIKKERTLMFPLGNKMAGDEDVRAMSIIHIKMRLPFLQPMN